MITLTIDNSCIKCGRCVAVCPARILTQSEKLGEISVVKLETCIKCGQCAAICPTDSVRHSLFPEDKVHSLNQDIVANADSLMELLRKRRSNRAFSKKEIPSADLDKILEAANLAPTSGNKQSLKYTLVTKPEMLVQIHKTTMEVCEGLFEQMKNAQDEESRKRCLLLRSLISKYQAGYEVIFRGATSVILIHSEDKMDGTDANLAYQNGSLMAEALGISHFYTGFLCIFSMFDVENKIKNVVGIKGTIHAGMALAMPKYTFDKYVDRQPQEVTKIV